MMAADRAMLYRLAVETGLRAGELRSLTRSSFQLEGKEPTVTIAAAYAKIVAGHAAIAAHDGCCLGDPPIREDAKAQAFTMPLPNRLVKMLCADLADGRKAWIAAAKRPRNARNAKAAHSCATRTARNASRTSMPCGTVLSATWWPQAYTPRRRRHGAAFNDHAHHGSVHAHAARRSGRAISELPALSAQPGRHFRLPEQTEKICHLACLQGAYFRKCWRTLTKGKPT